MSKSINPFLFQLHNRGTNTWLYEMLSNTQRGGSSMVVTSPSGCLLQIKVSPPQTRNPEITSRADAPVPNLSPYKSKDGGTDQHPPALDAGLGRGTSRSRFPAAFGGTSPSLTCSHHAKVSTTNTSGGEGDRSQSLYMEEITPGRKVISRGLLTVHSFHWKNGRLFIFCSDRRQ